MVLWAGHGAGPQPSSSWDMHAVHRGVLAPVGHPSVAAVATAKPQSCLVVHLLCRQVNVHVQLGDFKRFWRAEMLQNLG